MRPRAQNPNPQRRVRKGGKPSCRSSRRLGDTMSEARDSKPKRPRPKSRRRRESQGLDVAGMIDAFFQSHTVIKEGERSRRVTCFEAILHHLWLKSMAGNRKASKLLTRYMEFATSRGVPNALEIRVSDTGASDE